MLKKILIKEGFLIKYFIFNTVFVRAKLHIHIYRDSRTNKHMHGTVVQLLPGIRLEGRCSSAFGLAHIAYTQPTTIRLGYAIHTRIHEYMATRMPDT